MFLDPKKCKMLSSENLQIGDLIFYNKFIPEYIKEKKIYGIILNKLMRNEFLHYKIFFFNSDGLNYLNALPVPHFWCHKIEDDEE
jgi:hypothetical protein